MEDLGVVNKLKGVFTRPEIKERSRLASIKGENYVNNDYHDQLIQEMLQSYSVGDFCLIGPRGSGKNVVVEKMAEILSKEIENIVLYQDITSRDLIQQRMTLENGDTIWKNSPLIDAALKGKIAVVDGVHRVHPSTLTVLHRLVHDREIQLHDGTRLVSAEKYDFLIKEFNKTPDDLFLNGVLRIHPDFRIVALAEPPNFDAKATWLNSEVLSLFLFHEMRNLSKEEEIKIIKTKVNIFKRP